MPVVESCQSGLGLVVGVWTSEVAAPIESPSCDQQGQVTYTIPKRQDSSETTPRAIGSVEHGKIVHWGGKRSDSWSEALLHCQGIKYVPAHADDKVMQHEAGF
jgi:hypothetical protein